MYAVKVSTECSIASQLLLNEKRLAPPQLTSTAPTTSFLLPAVGVDVSRSAFFSFF